MSTTLVIATRELKERWRIFAVAAAMALIPFIVAAMPAARGNRGLTIATVGGGAGAVFAFAVALALGVSTIGRDLTDRRISFYFSKPLSPVALWAGKAIAGLLSVAAAAAIIILPSRLAAREDWTVAWNVGGRSLPLVAIVAALLLFFGGHAISTIVRSRSLLIVLDFILAILTVLAVIVLIRPFFFAGMQNAANVMLWTITGAVIVILALAPMWQLARGRADIRRNHHALSQAVWTGIASVFLVAGAYMAWLTSAPLRSLSVDSLKQNSSGSAVFVDGNASRRGGYPTSYLVNPSTGTAERMPLPKWWGTTFSRDGQVMSWLEPEGLFRISTLRVHVKRVDSASKNKSATSIRLPIHSAPVVLSDDGARMATVSGEAIGVYDVGSERMLAAAKRGRGHVRAIFFSSPDTLKIIQSTEGMPAERVLWFDELHIPTRKLTRTGQVSIPKTFNGLSSSEDGSRLYLRTNATIIDGRTGATIATLPFLPQPRFSASMLHDGSVAAVTPSKLHLFDRDGRHVKEIAIPAGKQFVLGQIGDTQVMLRGESGLTVVDLTRGAVVYTLPGVKGPGALWDIDPRRVQYAPDALLTGVDGDGKLIVWDAKGGQTRPMKM